jgi:hypothetical protein
MMAAGHALSFIAVALVKRALLDDTTMNAGDRLRLLEKLNGLTDLNFTAAMLALIDPMSDLELEIYREAKSLDPPRPKKDDPRSLHFQASFEILTSPKVFEHFIALNPGLAAAVRLYEQRGEAAPRLVGPAEPDFGDVSAPESMIYGPAPAGTEGRFSAYATLRQAYADGSDYRNPVDPFTGR